MAKFKISAGAEVDMVSHDEMAQMLDQMSRTWMAEVTRGIKHRRFQGRAPIVGGSVVVSQSVDNDMGPAGGMVWAVKAVSVTGLAVGDSVDVYLNGSDPICSMMRATGTGPIVRDGFDSNELILGPNDTLTVQGTGLSATGSVAVFGRCAEVPRNLTYKLQ